MGASVTKRPTVIDSRSILAGVRRFDSCHSHSEKFMVNLEHVAKLSSVREWNEWRANSPEIKPDLSDTFLNNRQLNEINFSGCILRGTILEDSELRYANFSDADISFAYFHGALLVGSIFSETQMLETDFSYSNLREARFSRVESIQTNFTGANLKGISIVLSRLDFSIFDESNLSEITVDRTTFFGTSFFKANMEKASFTNCYLKGSLFIETNINDAYFNACNIFGVSVWKVKGDPVNQTNLNISDFHEIEITVNSLEIAQFIYLILNNPKIKSIIDDITTKLVLILGRFSEEQKPILDMLRLELPKFNYVPIIFDFQEPNLRDLDETISILVSISKFIIADLTDPRSIPQELKGTIERLPSVPVQPILQEDRELFAMFSHFERYPWVLEVKKYTSCQNLQDNLETLIIDPIENWFSKNPT